MNRVFFLMMGTAVAYAAWNGTLLPLQDALFDMLRVAVMDVVFPLIGTLAFFLGLMKIAERAGAIDALARLLRPLLCRLFPDVPADHPAMGAIVLNLSSNALGLGNAATPFGIRAMQHLDELNKDKGVASDAMCLFIAINTSSVLIIPTEMIAIRSALGSDDPFVIVPSTIVATLCSTIAAIVAVRFLRRWSAPHVNHRVDATPPSLWPLVAIGVGLACMATLFVAYGPHLTPWVLPALLATVLAAGAWKRVPMYDAFVEGAKQGFEVAITILPYVVAILAAVGLLRGSGAIDAFVVAASPLTAAVGVPSELLPMALVRPLSGSGSLGLATELMQTHGPDSTLGILASTLHGSTETTFYVMAVYGGAIGLQRFRYALAAALTADFVAFFATIAAVSTYAAWHLHL